MVSANVKVKKWGNSLGVILPAEIVKDQNIEEDSQLDIMIISKKITKAGDIFGILKGQLGDVDELLAEVDRDFEKNGE